MPVAPFMLIMLMFALVAGIAVWQHERRKEAVMALGEALNLTARHEGFGRKGWTLCGDWKGWAVLIRFWQTGGKNSQDRTTVELDGLDRSIHIEHQGITADLFGSRHGDLNIGDPELDSRVILAGPERTLRGRLDAQTRALLRGLDGEGKLTVDSGTLSHQRRGHVFAMYRVMEMLDQYLALAERLRPGEVTDDHLLEIVRTDPVVAVRLNTALMLLEDPALTERVTDALDPAAPGTSELRDVLRGQGDLLVRDRAENLHDVALLAPDQVCGLLQRAGSEGALIELLSAHEPSVKVAAARALGAIGTVRAVEPLLPLTEGLLTDGAVKQAARQAVHEIQRRLGPVSAGSLSLSNTEAEAGRLALAERAGKLSLK